MSVSYHGLRNHNGGPNTVTRLDGTHGRPLDPCLDVRNHSPTGFEWGYGGSGPAQLALALCVDALDGDDAHALRIYQHVKWSLVAGFAAEDWTVSREEVLRTIARVELDLRDDTQLGMESRAAVQEAFAVETTTCPIHGTEHDARSMCPICEGEAKADAEGAWNR